MPVGRDLPALSSLIARSLVIALTSLMVLAACKSTATIEMMESTSSAEAPAQSDPAASDSATEPTTESTTDETPSQDDTTDAVRPEPVGNAKFGLTGQLPLSTDQTNELIDFIEAETGRDFLYPPAIIAQSPDVFIEGLQDDLGDFQTDSEVSVRTLQALGLTDRGVAEVTQAFETLLLSPEGILGYYDPIPDALYVPVGAVGDDQFRSLLVHELTHALDGQHTDLTVFDLLIEDAEETGNFEPVITLQAVAEGRATSVQNRWMAENGVVQEIPEDLGAAADVPPAMLLSLSIPYAFGEQFIEGRGGPAATWDLLLTPPVSSEVFLVPFGDPSDEPIIAVATPVADGPILDEAVYGAADIFVWLLGESLEPDPELIFPAFAAIDGWAGGRSVLWGDDNQSCIRIAIAADTETDLIEIQEAIDLWAANGVDRNVVIENDLVTATGCAAYLP